MNLISSPERKGKFLIDFDHLDNLVSQLELQANDEESAVDQHTDCEELISLIDATLAIRSILKTNSNDFEHFFNKVDKLFLPDRRLPRNETSKITTYIVQAYMLQLVDLRKHFHEVFWNAHVKIQHRPNGVLDEFAMFATNGDQSLDLDIMQRHEICQLILPCKDLVDRLLIMANKLEKHRELVHGLIDYVWLQFITPWIKSMHPECKNNLDINVENRSDGGVNVTLFKSACGDHNWSGEACLKKIMDFMSNLNVISTLWPLAIKYKGYFDLTLMELLEANILEYLNDSHDFSIKYFINSGQEEGFLLTTSDFSRFLKPQLEENSLLIPYKLLFELMTNKQLTTEVHQIVAVVNGQETKSTSKKLQEAAAFDHLQFPTCQVNKFAWEVEQLLVKKIPEMAASANRTRDEIQALIASVEGVLQVVACFYRRANVTKNVHTASLIHNGFMYLVHTCLSVTTRSIRKLQTMYNIHTEQDGVIDVSHLVPVFEAEAIEALQTALRAVPDEAPGLKACLKICQMAGTPDEDILALEEFARLMDHIKAEHEQLAISLSPLRSSSLVRVLAGFVDRLADRIVRGVLDLDDITMVGGNVLASFLTKYMDHAQELLRMNLGQSASVGDEFEAAKSVGKLESRLKNFHRLQALLGVLKANRLDKLSKLLPNDHQDEAEVSQPLTHNELIKLVQMLYAPSLAREKLIQQLSRLRDSS